MTKFDADLSVTELVFILDRSGSMQGLEKDTIGGFNSLIESQKEKDGICFVTTVLFDDKVEHLYDQVPLAKIEPLTSKQYFVRGCTALLDAVGETIKKVNAYQKNPKNGRPDKTIFVITTDGMENASHKFNLKQVRDLIEKRKEKNGWEFIFLGANIDAVETAGSLGIPSHYAADFDASEEGLKKMYGAVKCAICSLRCDEDLDEDWKASLKKD